MKLVRPVGNALFPKLLEPLTVLLSQFRLSALFQLSQLKLLQHRYGLETLTKEAVILLSHTPGVLSMARAQNPNSAGSQFFIMHETANYLDNQYAAFGQVIEGMDVVNKIAEVRTDFSDRPMKEQKIKSMTAETFGVTYPEPEKC